MSNNYLKSSFASVGEAIEPWKDRFEKEYCETVQDIIKSNPFMGRKFYIFQFVKRVDDLVGVKKMYHQARLTKPEPLPGTTLLHCDPKDPSTVKVIWTLPNEENFGLYHYGKVCADPFVYECVQKFLHDRKSLMSQEQGDLGDDEIRNIYRKKKGK